MSSIKIALLAGIAFAAPLALTVVYHLDLQRAPQVDGVDQGGRLIGKVLYFSSPG